MWGLKSHRCVAVRCDSGVEPPEPPIYGLKKYWFRDLIQGCRLHSEVVVWGPQLGTGVGPSQPPVRALAGAVVGAFNHWFRGSSQAFVEPLELLVPDRPVRALRGRQEPSEVVNGP